MADLLYKQVDWNFIGNWLAADQIHVLIWQKLCAEFVVTLSDVFKDMFEFIVVRGGCCIVQYPFKMHMKAIEHV
jgi:hypothetical protein